jgi:hypothetical protein
MFIKSFMTYKYLPYLYKTGDKNLHKFTHKNEWEKIMGNAEF